MPEHIIINDETYLYECLNCGFKSEPPWMTPPPAIAQDARDHFISEHKDCQSTPFAATAHVNDKIDHTK
jgi:hypothetical protein